MTTYLADFLYPLSDDIVDADAIERSFIARITPPPHWAKIHKVSGASSIWLSLVMKFNADDGAITVDRHINNIEPDLPCYAKAPFTEADRQAIFDLCCDEAADMSRREGGEAFMSDLDNDPAEAIGYACEFIDELAPMLRAIYTKNSTFNMEDEQIKEYCAAFAFRFELVDVQGLKLTPLGEDVMNRWD